MKIGKKKAKGGAKWENLISLHSFTSSGLTVKPY
jgi:hypothetical protein